MSDNTNKLAPAVIEAKILADATMRQVTLKSGTVATTPMNRKEFKTKFGLSNSDAKRLYVAHCVQFEAQAKADISNRLAAGFRIMRSTYKSGKHGERAGFTLVKTNAMSRETQKEVIARLTAKLAEATEKLSKINATPV